MKMETMDESDYLIIVYCIAILFYLISSIIGNIFLLVIFLVYSVIDIYYAFRYDKHIWDYQGWFRND